MDGHNVTIGVAEAESLTKGTVDGVSDNRDASLNQALVQRLGVTDMEPQGNAETRSRRHCFQVDSGRGSRTAKGIGLEVKTTACSGPCGARASPKWRSYQTP